MMRKLSLEDSMEMFVEQPNLVEFWFSSGLISSKIRWWLDFLLVQFHQILNDSLVEDSIVIWWLLHYPRLSG